MSKTIVTRIQNKYDSISNWSDKNSKLLKGEIAIITVPTGETYKNPVTGISEPVVELLMKVGDGEKTFDNLPWLSAKASDVYNWAKKPTAAEMPVIVNGTTSTLGAYLTKVDTNASNISTNTQAINTLNGADTVAGSVAKAIKDAIGALNYDTSTTDTSTTKISFVTAVTQADGKISVKKRNIIEADLPSIGSDKITVGDSTLTSKLSDVDSDISSLKAKNNGHTDEQINTLIDNKINALDGGTDSGTSGSGKYVSKVTQTNGKVATTYTSFPTASPSDAGITTLGVTGGAATYDSIFGSDGKGGINKQVETNKTDIASLRASVAGGVHFIGTTSAVPTSATVTKSDGSSHTATAGDVVIYSGKEYIYAGSAWEELGDVTRIGNLETRLDGLAYDGGEFGTSKFVTKVTIEDDKINATYAQPNATDISYSDSTNNTVAKKIAAMDATIAGKASATISAGAEDDKVVVLTGTSGNNGVSYKATHADSGVTAGTYRSVTVDAKGHITKGTNPTKISEYGITDVYTKADVYTKTEVNSELAKKADSTHPHPEYVNQNAFSKIAVSGQTTVEADAVTDTVEFVGSNVTITTDATNDKITFAVAKADANGETGIVTLSDSVASGSSATAATSKAVKDAYDKATTASSNISKVSGRVDTIEATYAKFNNADSKLYVGTEEIIFDCGGAV